MATFTYIAADRSGTTRRGTISAANTHEAAELVRSKGLVLMNVSAARSAGGTIAVRSAAPSYEPRQSRLSAGGGIAVKDMSIFTSQLGTMLNAGLSITKSLDVQSKQLSNKKLRMITEDLKKKVESGLPLSTAMTDYPGAFSTLYTSMVMSGEGSGNLGNSLLKMATFLEREAELKRKIKSATSYPLIVIIASVAIIIGLFIFVLPQFVGFLTALNVPLPMPTRITLAMSDFLVHRWYILFVAVVAIFFGARALLRTPQGIHFKDNLALKAPVIGPLVLQTSMARFTDTLSTLFGAGVPLISCLEMVGGTMGNSIVSATIDRVITSIKSGTALSAAMAETQFFTPMVIQMTAVGEESGSLETMLGKVATFYQAEVDAATDNLTNAINPILMIVVGGMIGWVLISLYLPIFKMAGGIS
ncbi:type II secretion system F family protein [Candidatus Cryosericum odellii]|jgi:type IV pilus assembly protein PilC|uniref:Type II secretion system F family protein n=1 Tax=Candidatus Cryosericum odellii TaxID=2290917 RepID=A0A398CXD2_9BACT|nr:type II secretion system F family protein [Candidatus Cryosericum odellii]RIE07315.1 type II secretion system F family protein [Candidatus Cryosericum odellii]RIE08790.1 type II secretion system F family protein [Candidatus Cryosericum odellii]